MAALVGLVAVGCARGSSPPPEPSTETQAELSVAAIDVACNACSTAPTLYVRDQLFNVDTLAGDEQPMPQAVASAISAAYPHAVFVDAAAASALFDDGGVISDGLLVEVGPIEELDESVVGLSIGLHTARDGGRWIIVQFQWDGDQWRYATSDDTGITVTTAVS